MSTFDTLSPTFRGSPEPDSGIEILSIRDAVRLVDDCITQNPEISDILASEQRKHKRDLVVTQAVRKSLKRDMKLSQIETANRNAINAAMKKRNERG